MLVQRENTVKLGIPPVFRDTAVIRVTEHTFGPNSKDNPMVTTKWELCGVPNATGGLDTTVKLGGKEYKIAGLRLTPVWFTLVGRGVDSYAKLWEIAHPGEVFPGVDNENPDVAWLDNLAIYAMIQATSVIQYKAITDEEKEALKAVGKEPIGEPILDPDGKPITSQTVSVVQLNMEPQFLKKYTGEIAPF